MAPKRGSAAVRSSSPSAEDLSALATAATPAPASPPVANDAHPLILTIGHSTRTIEEFITLLQAHDVTRLVDIRTVPRSRRNPQYNRDVLPDLLRPVGIGYVHSAELGGLRRTSAASINTGWRNLSFRGYADHMQTLAFALAIDQLLEWARDDRLVLMCAEAVPWRCHRSLIADALLVRNVRCEDISSPKRRTPHRITRFACVRGTQITYPPDCCT